MTPPSRPATLGEYLRRGVDGLAPHWNADRAELDDPVVGEPTQYGTAYFGLASAAAAGLRTGHGGEKQARDDLDRAAAATARVLAHLADGAEAPAVSTVAPGALAMRRGNHRDFMWPAVLRTVDVLRANGHPETAALDAAVAALVTPDTFNARPPSNWAAVWLSGEWRRIRAGRSRHTPAEVDDWLEPFFTERIDLAQGLFREPGLPNSYDLFTRVHLQDMVAQGYSGRWSAELAELARTGLHRTLGVQLSDGSLGCAHRSTAQTWTLGAQLAFLAAANREIGPGDAADQGLPGALARAHAALATTLRPDGTVSPVQNGLPASYRVGYEGYTADAHYTSLALGFVAAAIGSGADIPPAGVRTDDRDSAHIEHEPTYRALRHRGRFSVHLNLDPQPSYDGFGIVDLTVGVGRRLQFVSSAAVAGTKDFVNLGIAQRDGDALDVVARRTFGTDRSFAATSDGLTASARDESDNSEYAAQLRIGDSVVEITEALPGTALPLSLLVPYPREVGDGATTTVHPDRTGVVLAHGDERLRITVGAPIERIITTEYGLTNRRGLCGLVRIDLADPRDRLDYSVAVDR